MVGTQLPALQIAEKCHILNIFVDGAQKNELKQDIVNIITAYGMADLYEVLTTESVLELDGRTLKRMRMKNIEKLLRLNRKMFAVQRSLHDRYFFAAYINKFNYLIQIFHKAHIISHLRMLRSNQPRRIILLREQMDILFCTLQFHFYYLQLGEIQQLLHQGKDFLKNGHHCDVHFEDLLKLKNRLKVYEGLFYMCSRDFKKAAQLFLETTMTFNCFELFPRKTFIFYTVLTNIVSSNRMSLQQVLDSPGIQPAIHETQYVLEILNSFILRQYNRLFRILDHLRRMLLMDRYLAPFTEAYIKEVRRVAYIQYIQPYEIVSMVSMASDFGVREDVISRDVNALLIRSRILNYQMDKLNGILMLRRIQA